MIETERILTVAPPGLSLRRMLDSDLPFLEELYASTRQNELAQVPWSADEKRGFLRWQFVNQHQYYQQYYPHCEFLIVERTGADGVERLGRLYVDRWPDQIRLVDISLTPEFRGRGIGRMLMEEILEEGRATRKARDDSCRTRQPGAAPVRPPRISTRRHQRRLPPHGVASGLTGRALKGVAPEPDD